MRHKTSLIIFLPLLLLSATCSSQQRPSYFVIKARCKASEIQTIVISSAKIDKQFVVTNHSECDNIVTVVYSYENDRAKNELARVASYEAVLQFIRYHEQALNRKFDYELLGTSIIVFSPHKGFESSGAKRATVNFFRLIEFYND